jgi:hypothetical protein
MTRIAFFDVINEGDTISFYYDDVQYVFNYKDCHRLPNGKMGINF